MAWHKRILGRDGLKTEFYWSNPDTGEVALQTVWNVEDIVKDAKGLYAMRHRNDRWGDREHVAWLPLFAVEKVLREEGRNLLTDKERLRYWLNNPDNSVFRTRPGRI